MTVIYKSDNNSKNIINLYFKNMNSISKDQNKLSILLVSFEFPDKTGSTRGGGVSTVYYELANGLADLGHDVLVLTHGDKEDFYRENNYYVWRIDSYDGLSENWKNAEHVQCRSKNVAKKVFYTLSKASFDIVQFPELNGEGYYFFKENKNGILNNSIKTVVRIHSSTKPYRKLNNILSAKDKIIMDMEKLSIERCDLLIYPSENNLKKVISTMNIKNISNSIYIPNSINHEYFKPKKNENNSEYLKIGYAGKIRDPKGTDILIRSFSEIADHYPNIELSLIGNQKYYKNKKLLYTDLLTQSLPDEIKNRMKIYKKVDRKKLIEYYQSLDLFVFPSRYENFPNSLMEAMSCGLPVIATNVGGVSELLGPNNPSIIIPPNDYNALCNSLIKMIVDPNLRNKSGDYNRKRIIENFSREFITKKYIEAYFNIIR